MMPEHRARALCDRGEAAMRQVDALIGAQALCEKREHVLVAFSGGADSVFLLSYFFMRGYRVSAFHVNHGIRPEAAGDEAFCREFCRERNIPYASVRCDVPALAAQRKLTVEQAARLARYDAIGAHCAAVGADCVATAHHGDDQAETLILRLLRGSGAQGMRGILPRRAMQTQAGRITLIRPLLTLKKKEILAACEQLDLPYVTDVTNADTQYARNAVRAAIAPLLGRPGSGAYPQTLLQFSTLCAEDEAYFSEVTDAFLAQHAGGDDACRWVDRGALAKQHRAVGTRILIRLYQAVTQQQRRARPELQLSYRQVEAIYNQTVRFSHPFQFSLPHSVTFCCYDDRAVFYRAENAPKTETRFLLSAGENRLFGGSVMIYIGQPSAQEKASYENIYKLSTNTRLNFDTLNQSLYAQRREALQPGVKYPVRGHLRSVKKLLADNGVPQVLRGATVVITDARGMPVWTPFCPPRDGAGAPRGKGEEIQCWFAQDFSVDFCNSVIKIPKTENDKGE